MEIRQLKYFLAVADQRSFINAASSLYLSRQAVSKSISQLEHELGVELFMRDSNGAYLTPAGVLFYDRIRSNVMDFDQIQSELQEYGERYHQTLRIVFSAGITELFEEKMELHQKNHPNISLSYFDCMENQCIPMLLDRRANIAVTFSTTEEKLLSFKKVRSMPYGLAVSRDSALAGCSQISTEQLKKTPLGVLEISPGEMPEAAGALGVRPAYQGCNLSRLFALARRGVCALLLPKDMALTAEELVWVPLHERVEQPVWFSYLQTLENSTFHCSVLDELLLQTFGCENTIAMENR